MTQIQFSSLQFEYTGTLNILDDVTLPLSGGWVGVTGPNGSGKTTPLRFIAGDLSPTSGQRSRVPSEVR
jgi:ABC-type Mn2+/Zn2+ transport system ATPase subunit